MSAQCEKWMHQYLSVLSRWWEAEESLLTMNSTQSMGECFQVCSTCMQAMPEAKCLEHPTAWVVRAPMLTSSSPAKDAHASLIKTCKVLKDLAYPPWVVVLCSCVVLCGCTTMAHRKSKLWAQNVLEGVDSSFISRVGGGLMDSGSSSTSDTCAAFLLR